VLVEPSERSDDHAVLDLDQVRFALRAVAEQVDGARDVFVHRWTFSRGGGGVVDR